MSINLSKGQKVALGRTNVRIELGWTPNQGTGHKFDLDASVFLLDDNKMIPSDCVNSANDLRNTLRPIITMVQCMKRIVNALETTDIMLIQNATRVTSPSAKNENIRPINKKSGAPGGCGTCNL